jgi:hypothetical protein
MEVTDDLIQHYSKPLVGEGLPATRLGDLVQAENMLILHFLRHLGCAFCKHTVDQLRQLKEQMPRFPTIYFVHQSDVETGHRFFAERWPGSPHISDPKTELFRLFGIRRMRGLGLLDPRMVLATLRLQLKGYRNELGYGDVYLLSGTFLFRNGKLVWKHRASFAGDDPNWGILGKKPG